MYSGLQLTLTPSWQVQKVKTLLDSLFLRRINLLLKDLSSGNCGIGEGLYLNQNWSLRVHFVIWSFIYILCAFYQEGDACGTITSLNVVWSSDYIIRWPVVCSSFACCFNPLGSVHIHCKWDHETVLGLSRHMSHAHTYLSPTTYEREHGWWEVTKDLKKIEVCLIGKKILLVNINDLCSLDQLSDKNLTNEQER